MKIAMIGTGYVGLVSVFQTLGMTYSDEQTTTS